MFSFSSTSDKVMGIILQNEDMPVPELIGTIRSRLGLSQAEIDSALLNSTSKISSPPCMQMMNSMPCIRSLTLSPGS